VQLAGYSLAGVRPSQLSRHLETPARRACRAAHRRRAGAPPRTTRLKQWGVELDTVATQQAILKAWARVPLWERLFGAPRLQIEPHWAAIPELFQAQLERYRFLERAPRDARVRFAGGMVKVLPSQSGQTLALEPSLQNLQAALRELPAAQTRFELAMRPTPPAHSHRNRPRDYRRRRQLHDALSGLSGLAQPQHSAGSERARTGVSCCLASVSRTIKRSASARSSRGSAPRP
jgi:hypothetical protein